MEVELRAHDGRAVCERCVIADAPLARMKGLLGKKELGRGEGILLRPAASVHTWFMRFPIDVVFLDRELQVMRVVPALAPWKAAGSRGAVAVLELAAGECERRRVAPGDRLILP